MARSEEIVLLVDMDDYSENEWGDIAGYVVVRCRDCIHFRKADASSEPRCTGQMAFAPSDPYGFCKWGERVG